MMCSESSVRLDASVLATFALVFQQRLSDVCAHGDISYVLYRRQYLNIPPPDYQMLIRAALETAATSQQEGMQPESEQYLIAPDASSIASSSCTPEPVESWGKLSYSCPCPRRSDVDELNGS